MARKKKADQIRELYNLSNNWTRQQWQYVNQKGYEFAHDEQLSSEEKRSLEEQGMPTFTRRYPNPLHMESLIAFAYNVDPSDKDHI